jgi:uncharacterized protein (TIGR03083 family)
MAELARGDLTEQVPTCPAWTLADLIEHTGRVHRWMIAAIQGDGSPQVAEDDGPVDGASLGDWFQRGVDEAVRVMSAMEGTEARWTWFPPDQTAGWYFRRIAQETLVHRIDAELAAGVDVMEVEPALAADGVDEMCDVFIPSATGQPIGGRGETLHLHATDVEGEWLLTLHPEHVEVSRGHAKGDAALRGPARDLLLMMWGRDPLGDVEHFGDESVIATFRAAAKVG